MVVIVSCGSLKLLEKSTAVEMYIGKYFRLNIKYAKSLTSLDRIFILSAKYGLLKLDDVIEPYSLKLGNPGSVSASHVKNQALEFGILEDRVTVLGGSLYVKLCKQVWTEVDAPLNRLGKMGTQMKWIRDELDKQRGLHCELD